MESNLRPLFSVIITTYNRKELLPKAIESVLNQTFNDFELLVIDNGSTDGTPDVVRVINDSRLKFMVNPKPTNSCEAPRNLAIGMAKGKLIAFLDDDERWYPDRLKKVKEVFDTSGPDVSSVCHNLNIRKDGELIGVWEGGAKAENLFEGLLYERTLLVPVATTIKTEVLKNLNGFSLRKEFEACADYDLWLRMAKSDIKIKFIDDILGEFFITGYNLSIADCSFTSRLTFLIREHILRYEKRPIWRLSKRGLARLMKLNYVSSRSFFRAHRYLSALRDFIKVIGYIVIRPTLISSLHNKNRNS